MVPKFLIKFFKNTSWIGRSRKKGMNVKLAPFEKFLNFKSRKKKKFASLKTLCFLFFFVKKHDLFLFAPVARNLRTKSEIQAWQQCQPQWLTESHLLDPQNASFLLNYISFTVVNHLNPSVEIYGLLINSVSTFGERIFIEEQWALFNGIVFFFLNRFKVWPQAGLL